MIIFLVSFLNKHNKASPEKCLFCNYAPFLGIRRDKSLIYNLREKTEPLIMCVLLALNCFFSKLALGDHP